MSPAPAPYGNIKRGQIVVLNLVPSSGDEYGKPSRPAVVVSPDKLNEKLTTLVVVPCTSEKPHRKANALEIALPAGEGGLDKNSIAVPNQVRVVDKDRIVKVGTAISPGKLDEITGKLMVAIGAIPIPG